MERTIRVTVFNEHNQDKTEPVKSVYPEGLHSAIAACFPNEEGFEVRCATQEMPWHGMPEDVLTDTDVLVWWSHLDNSAVDDNVVSCVCRRVLEGMGFIVLHSATFSKPWERLMGIYPTSPEGWGRYRSMPKGEREIAWVVTPGHPIMQGVGEFIDIPQDECYGEPLLLPQPEELLMISWYEGGQVSRSATTYRRGRGRIFCFTPGHEEFPIYRMSQVRRVLANAAVWAASKEPAPFKDRALDNKPLTDLSHRQ